jgi:hypothetical protein
VAIVWPLHVSPVPELEDDHRRAGVDLEHLPREPARERGAEQVVRGLERLLRGVVSAGAGEHGARQKHVVAAHGQRLLPGPRRTAVHGQAEPAGAHRLEVRQPRLVRQLHLPCLDHVLHCLLQRTGRPLLHAYGGEHPCVIGSVMQDETCCACEKTQILIIRPVCARPRRGRSRRRTWAARRAATRCPSRPRRPGDTCTSRRRRSLPLESPSSIRDRHGWLGTAQRCVHLLSCGRPETERTAEAALINEL